MMKNYKLKIINTVRKKKTNLEKKLYFFVFLLGSA